MYLRRVLFALTALLLSAPVSAATSQRTYLPQINTPAAAATNLTLTSATYLGGSGADSASAIDIALDGSVLLGGSFVAGFIPAGSTPSAPLGSGVGALVRLSADGKQLRGVTQLPGAVKDLEAGPDGVLVCGDFGVALLSADASAVSWSQSGAVSRCALGSDGVAVTLTGASVNRYGSSGTLLKSWSVPGTEARDIAVDGVSQRVIVTGYTQDDGYTCSQYKSAYLRGYDYDGVQQWRDYGWSKTEVGDASLCADTRGDRVAIGRDGQLYFGGWTDGGNNVYSRDPQNLAGKLSATQQVKTDKFNDPYGLKGAKSLVWYGRYRAASGALDQGQMLLTRLADNSGNSISVRGITADARGQIYLTGEAYYQIDARDSRTINGALVGSYEGGEPYLLVVSADLRTRLLWTPLTATGAKAGGSPGSGIAVRGQTAAAAVNFGQSTDGLRRLVTVTPIQAVPGGGTDAYVAVWPAR